MKTRTPLTLLLILVAALVAAPAAPLAQSVDQILLKQAIDLEKAKGDVKGAIEIYKKLVASQDPIVAAAAREALSRNTASAGARGPAGQVIERTIWTGSDVPTAMNVSHDGRFMPSLRDDALFVRDLTTGTDRMLVPRQPAAAQGEASGFVAFAAFSQDGKFIAYDWRVQQGADVYDELRIVPVDGGMPPPTPRTLLVDRATGGFSIRPTEWSPDGSAVAVIIGHPAERTRQLGLVDVKTGSLRVLKTVGFRSPSRLSFSPDGAYIAFDLPAGADAAQRDIYLIHIRSARETALIVGEHHDELAGWAPDGRVLFVSNRQGVGSLWAQSVSDGQPIGPAVMLRGEVGWPVAITAGGSFIHIARTSFPRIYTVPIDLSTARATEPPAPVRARWSTNALPAWSPDGRSLAYLSMPRGDSIVILSIQDVVSGSVRERVLPVTQVVDNLRWSPDANSILMSGADLNNQRAIFTTDVQTLETTVLVRPPQNRRFVYPDWLDAATVFYLSAGTSPGTNMASFVTRNSKTGEDRVLFDSKLPPGRFGAIAPDRSKIALSNDDLSAILVRDLQSGTEREVYRTTLRSLLGGPVAEWTPDGRALLIRRSEGPGPWTLWLVPLDGSDPRQIDVGIPNLAGFVRMSSDGKLAFSAGVDQRELRVIEGMFRAGSIPRSN